MTARLPRKKWPIIAGAAVCLLLAGLAVLWAAGAFRLKTQDGTIVLENLPPDAEVLVDGEKVALKLKGDDKPIEIQVAPGKRNLEIKAGGFKMETQEVTLASGERKPIDIRLEPLAAASEKPVPPTLPKEEAPDLAPDRKAAEYVLSIGGVVRVNDEVDDDKAVADLPQVPFRLTYVSLCQNPKVRNAGLAAFKGCNNLTVLNLHETNVKDEGLANFKDCDCKNLTTLDLTSTHVTDVGLAYFKDCKKVQDLHLNFTHVTDVGLAYFSGCENLKYIDLFAVPVTGDFLAHFKDCSKLEHLDLEGTKFNDAALAHLQNCKNLLDLKLLATQVTDKGMVYLKGCNNLQSLGLAHTTVSDVGLANFMGCKKLRELRLHNTLMTDTGLAYFKGCDKLERLEQRGSKVTKAGLDDFRKALPKCRIDIQPDQQ